MTISRIKKQKAEISFQARVRKPDGTLKLTFEIYIKVPAEISEEIEKNFTTAMVIYYKLRNEIGTPTTTFYMHMHAVKEQSFNDQGFMGTYQTIEPILLTKCDITAAPELKIIHSDDDNHLDLLEPLRKTCASDLECLGKIAPNFVKEWKELQVYLKKPENRSQKNTYWFLASGTTLGLALICACLVIAASLTTGGVPIIPALATLAMKILFIAATLTFAAVSTFAFHKAGGFAKFFHSAPASASSAQQPSIAPRAARYFPAIAAPPLLQAVDTEVETKKDKMPESSPLTAAAHSNGK